MFKDSSGWRREMRSTFVGMTRGESLPTHPPRGRVEEGDPLMPMLFAFGQHPVGWRVCRVATRPCWGNLCDFGKGCKRMQKSGCTSAKPGQPDWWNRKLSCGREIHTNLSSSSKDEGAWGAHWSRRVRLSFLGEEQLFQRIPWTQSAWFPFSHVREQIWLCTLIWQKFSHCNDANVWMCLDTILGSPSAPGMAKVFAILSFSGGLWRNREAHWASWADCLRRVHDWHPDIAEIMITQLEVGIVTCFWGCRATRMVELSFVVHVHREKGCSYLFMRMTQNWLERNKTFIRCGKYSTLGEPTSFLDHVYLGCTQRQYETSKDIDDNCRCSGNLRISSWFCDVEGHAKKCAERHCALANRTTQELHQGSTPCIDDHLFQEEELKPGGGLSKICSQIVF